MTNKRHGKWKDSKYKLLLESKPDYRTRMSDKAKSKPIIFTYPEENFSELRVDYSDTLFLFKNIFN